MFKRTRLALAASAVALAMSGGFAAAQETLKIGASAPKTGPLAGGAAVTHWPSVKLWIHEINARGGLKVGGKNMKVELIEYDDKTSGEEAVKNIQRLATIDKVDFLVPPYSTGINVATAPIIAKYGYPHVATSAVTQVNTHTSRVIARSQSKPGNSRAVTSAVASMREAKWFARSSSTRSISPSNSP